MGLLHVQLCVKKGCLVIVTDMDEERLKLAKTMGAQYTINPHREHAEKRILELTHSRKAQVVFDTTPAAAVVEEACRYVGNTGKLMIYSGIYPNKPVQLDAHWIHKYSDSGNCKFQRPRLYACCSHDFRRYSGCKALYQQCLCCGKRTAGAGVILPGKHVS